MTEPVSFPGALKQAFPRWRAGVTTLDDRDVYVLQAAAQGRQTPVNLYFDSESGLLVRMLRFTDTAVGRVPTQIDFADYREVSGIKIPFRTTATWTDGQATIELAEVAVNTAIDNARFLRPAPAAPFK